MRLLLWILGISIFNDPSGRASEEEGMHPQDKTAHLEDRILFSHLTVEDGLSGNKVKNIIQDRNGFLWLGTEVGLNRYDGQRFTIFETDPQNPCAISGYDIRALYVDRRGVLWVGTRYGGLQWLEEDTGCFRSATIPGEGGSRESHISALLEDSRGNFWVGSGNGLSLRKPGIDVFEPVFRESDKTVLSLFEDTRGDLWVGTRFGLEKLGPSREWSPDQPRAPVWDKPGWGYVTSILEDRQGLIWIGGSHGLASIDPNTTEARAHTLSESPAGIVFSLLEDDEGTLWVGTFFNGVFRGGRGQDFKQSAHIMGDAYSLSHNRVRVLFQDNTGIIWLGTDLGASKYDRYGHLFDRLAPGGEKGLTGPWVLSVLEDRDGVLWVGSDGTGLDRVDRQNNQVSNFRFRKHPINGNNRIFSMLEDREGALWLGLASGLVRFQHRNSRIPAITYMQDLPEAGDLADKRIVCLTMDKWERLWIATRRGLFRLGNPYAQPSENMILDRPRDLLEAKIYTIYEDSMDHLLFGTDMGLYRFVSDEQPIEAVVDDMRGGMFVSSITEDSEGRLWFAVIGQGLMALDRESGELTTYRVSDETRPETITGLQVEECGVIWMVTPRSIVRFDPRDKSFRTFDNRDDHFNLDLIQNAHYWSSDGELFFGSSKGLNSFFPSKMMDDPNPPGMVLTDIRIDGRLPGTTHHPARPAHLESSLTLEPDHYMVSFRFAALHYGVPTQNSYAERLEGWEPLWLYTAKGRGEASFTNLDPGNYVLRLKGSNKDGIWSEKELRLELRIKPPFWQTWWARCLYVMTLLLAFLMYRQRQKSKAHERLMAKEEQARILHAHLERRSTEIAQDLHDGPLNDLSRLIYDLNSLVPGMAEGDVFKQLRLFDGRVLPEISSKLRNICGDLLAPDFEDGLELELEACADLIEKSNPDLTISRRFGGLERITNGQQMAACFRIARTLLANVARHAGAGRASLELRVVFDQIVMEVTDNGCGFEAPEHLEHFKQNKHYGLYLAGYFAESIGGKLHVKSELGAGTRINMSAPLYFEGR